MAASFDREEFVQAMVRSITTKQEIEKQLIEVPINQLSSSALAQLDEVALNAADSLTYDFPSPSTTGVQSLIKAITFCTGPNPRESLFIRTFSISARFLDGIVYCCSRHTVKKEVVLDNTEESSKDHAAISGAVNDSGLPSNLSAELAAVVFVKCVRFMLEAPLHVVSRMLRDEALDTDSFDSVIKSSAIDVDESLNRMESMMNTHSQVEGSADIVPEDRLSQEEEVWATELDDDDVPYEGAPTPLENISSSARGASSEIGYGGQRYQANQTLSSEDCQKRLGYIIRYFSSNFLSGISSASWKQYDLVRDMCAIIRHLRPTTTSNSLLLTKPKLKDGTTLSLPAWVEEGWVEYTYALRDNVLCEAYDPSALEFLLAQLDQEEEEGEEIMSPARCISFVVLHTVVNSRFNLPILAMRQGLLGRLELVLAECMSVITDSLTVIAAAGTEAAVDGAVVDTASSSSSSSSSHPSISDTTEEEKSQSKALLYEQAKVLLVLVGFALGVSLSSDAVVEAKMLTVLPPASTIIRSQVFRNILKLVCVLGVKPSFKEGSVNPHVLGLQLLVMLVSHSPELADFAARAPMTGTLLEQGQAEPTLVALLALSLASSSNDSANKLDGVARMKCQALVELASQTGQVSAITSLMASFAYWHEVAIRRLQGYMNSTKGGWFKVVVLSAQRMIVSEKRNIVDIKADVPPPPSPPSSTTTSSTTTATASPPGSSPHVVDEEQASEQDEEQASEQASMKGPEKRRLVHRADAIKGAKILLEKSAGDNKTD